VYASHLMNRSTAIGGKAPLEISSRKTAQDHGLLREFRSPTYFSAKNGKVNPRAKRFVFWVSKGIATGCGTPKTRRSC